MANRRGVVSQARRRQAQKHAKKPHHCIVCDQTIMGNGGWSSHKRAHVRDWIKCGRKTEGLPEKAVESLEYWTKKYWSDARKVEQS